MRMFLCAWLGACTSTEVPVDACKNDGSRYADLDGDGYGDEAAPAEGCGDATAAEGGDCDDAVRAVNPSAAELCDGVDNDCDGTVDVGAADGDTFYPDGDGDGYGRTDSPVESCAPAEGLAAAAGDCDDGDDDFHPGAAETDCSDPNDYNCDGSVGFADADDDGFPACEECDDATAATNPAATETCDGADNDCDGTADEELVSTWYADADGDGFGDAATAISVCEAPPGSVADGTDCDDASAERHPGAEEFCDDPTDYNCDGSTGYSDADGDGIAACNDCDDLDAAAFPGAIETCDGADNDCDTTIDEPDASDAGTWYADTDGDGSGEASTAVIACEAPAGYVADPGDDCDATDPAVFPGAPELCDLRRNDCDDAAWTTAAEAGHVSAENAAGAWTSLTDAFAAGTAGAPATIVLPSEGTVWLCDGTWIVVLEAPAAGSVTVEGRNGATAAVLDGGNAGSVLSATGGATVTVTGVTLQNGGGTVPADRTAVYGGAVYADGGTVALVDVVVSANSADFGGGAYLGAGELNLDGASFTLNSASSGGAVYAEGGTLTVTDASFSSNSASYGGGIYAATTAVVGGATFDSNTATSHGAGVYFSTSAGDTLTVSGGEFSAGYAGSSGGGLYASAGGIGAIVVDGARFEGNVATYGGGAYLAGSTSGTVTVADVVINGNFTTGYGGGLYVTLAGISSLSLEGSEVADNITRGSYGGGAYITSSSVATVDVLDCAFTGNEAAYYGGGAYFNLGSYGVSRIEGTSFDGNEAGYRGGGFSLASSSDLAITDVSVEANVVTGASTTCYGAGAFVDLDGGVATVSGFDASANSFSDPAATAQGGGAYLSIGSAVALEVEDSSFSSNTGATNGGGAYVVSSSTDSMVFDGVAIEQNQASCSGGGLYVSSKYQTELSGVTIRQNEISDSGCYGAGAWLTGTVEITDSALSGNAADAGVGGGFGASGATVTVVGTTIAANTAARGAGLYGTASTVTLDATSMLFNNDAGDYGGGAYLSGTDLTCTGDGSSSGGILKNTATSLGGGVYLADSGATLTAVSCDTGSGANENRAAGDPSDVWTTSATYEYGDAASFSCSGRGCL